MGYVVRIFLAAALAAAPVAAAQAGTEASKGADNTAASGVEQASKAEDQAGKKETAAIPPKQDAGAGTGTTAGNGSAPAPPPGCVGADKQPDGLAWDDSTPYSKELKAKSPDDPVFQLGDPFELRATGKRCKEILDGTKGMGGVGGLTLVLQGVSMPDLRVSWSECRDNPSAMCIRFDLVRDSNNPKQRAAWDQLFGQKWGAQMDLDPRLAIGKDLPLVIDGAKPFRVAPTWLTVVTAIAGMIVFSFGYYKLLGSTTFLRDAGSTCFSLGKAQMAFWWLLVLVSFACVYIVTRTMEFIPDQVLVLIGISSATGLAAIAIGTGNGANPALPAPPVGADQAPAVPAQKNADGLRKDFFADILNDGNGPSVHRLQVVVWTLVLGIVFIVQVLHVISMPQFPETLLILMGISHGTYLGFKWKE